MNISHFPSHRLGDVQICLWSRDQPHAHEVGFRSHTTYADAVVALGRSHTGTSRSMVITPTRFGIIILSIPIVLKILQNIRCQIRVVPLHTIIHDTDDDSAAPCGIFRACGGVVPHRFHIDIGSRDRALLALVFQVPLELDEWVIWHRLFGSPRGKQRGCLDLSILLGKNSQGGEGGGGFVNKGIWREDGGFLEDKPLLGCKDIRLGL